MSQTEQITIQGHPFRVPMRYQPGHQLSENEANALNQTLHENLRNIWSPRVKRALGEGTSPEQLQEEFDRYAAEYQFGRRQRRAGGDSASSETKVMSVALSLARDIVRRAVRDKGLDWSTTRVSEAAKQLLDRQGPDGALVQSARARVEAEQTAGQSVQEDVDSIVYQAA
jgi:hypothetical protein